MRDNPLPMGKGRSKRLLALSGLFALIGLAFALRYRPAIPNNYTTGASGTEAAGAQEDVVAMPLDESSVVNPVSEGVLDVIEVDTFEPAPPVVELPPPLPPGNRTTFADIPSSTVDEEAAPGDVSYAIYGAAACATLVAGMPFSASRGTATRLLNRLVLLVKGGGRTLATGVVPRSRLVKATLCSTTKVMKD
ncbi:hypothetical protein NLJ89_g12268 [Agrocybe chaxingu]|uniref:Uncharacterized protein n=1 Tax=Agrocybe chaxingu TaxID=84603 RepID=A0A9W8MNN1_9AGAR|nr:hypothetical protein NLJ89_g12268 [Agrocybe chaxingu]